MKQRNGTHDEGEKNQYTETDSKLAPVLELADKTLQQLQLCLYVQKIRCMEDIKKKIQANLLELKTTMHEAYSTLSGRY